MILRSRKNKTKNLQLVFHFPTPLWPQNNLYKFCTIFLQTCENRAYAYTSLGRFLGWGWGWGGFVKQQKTAALLIGTQKVLINEKMKN